MKNALGAAVLLGLGLLELASCSGFGTAPGETPGPDGGGIDGESITPVQLAIESVSMDPKVVAPQARDTAVTVRLKRAGFLEPVEVSFPNLPKGITSEKVFVERGKDTAVLVLHVAKDAPLGPAANLRVFANGGVTKIAEASLEIVGAPGALDLSFGGAGQVDGPAGRGEVAYDAALLQDGSMLIAGKDAQGAFVRRLTSEGLLDTSYGDGGIARPTQISIAKPEPYEYPFAIVALPDGRALLAAKGIRLTARTEKVGLVTISADGKSFTTLYPSLTGFETVRSISEVAPSRYVLVGMREDVGAGSTAGGGLIAMAFASGARDTSWGADVQLNPASWPARPGFVEGSWTRAGIGGDGFFALSTKSATWLLGDAGYKGGGSLEMAKLTPAGKFDLTYADNGINTYDQPDPFIGAAAYENDVFLTGAHRRDGFTVRRFDGGKADASFGVRAVAVPGVVSRLAVRENTLRERGFVRDRRGALLLGSGFTATEMPSRFLARVNSSGNLDSDFGDRGVVTIVGDFAATIATNVLIQSSGRILTIGTSSMGGDTRISITRHWPSLQGD